MSLVDRQQAKELLKNAKNILIAPSSPMDGDSVGSALALMVVLRKLGKNVSVVAYDPLPDYLKFLPFISQIQSHISPSKDFVISLSTENAEVEHLKYEVEQGRINIIVTPKDGFFAPHDIRFVKQEANFDLIVTVDTGDLVQLGKLYEENKELFTRTNVLNIDHHASNGKFGSHNFLVYNSASTTQMLTPLLLELEKEQGEELMDEDVATLLLVGLITDTGSFQHSNTSPEAFEMAAELLDRGARQQEIIKHIFKTKSLATLRLWGRVLSRIQFMPEIGLVYSTVTLQDLADTGATPDDTGGIIDELMSNAPGAEVVMLLKEKDVGFVSGSFRAPGKLADVSEIAQQMNGGGHKKAAGFRIREKSMEEALALAKQTVAAYMRDKMVKPQAQPIPPAVETSEPVETSEVRLFPGLVSKPQNTIPTPDKGGEDLLLQDFRNRQNPDPMREQTVRFFQDSDAQEKPSSTKTTEPTVGDILSKLDD